MRSQAEHIKRSADMLRGAILTRMGSHAQTRFLARR